MLWCTVLAHNRIQCIIQHLISSEEAADSVEACVNLIPWEHCTCSIHRCIHYTEVLWNLEWHCSNTLHTLR